MTAATPAKTKPRSRFAVQESPEFEAQEYPSPSDNSASMTAATPAKAKSRSRFAVQESPPRNMFDLDTESAPSPAKNTEFKTKKFEKSPERPRIYFEARIKSRETPHKTPTPRRRPAMTRYPSFCDGSPIGFLITASPIPGFDDSYASFL